MNSGTEKHVFQAETQDVFDEPSLDPVYHAKARILNDALQDIGMGKYQASLVSFRSLSPCSHSAMSILRLVTVD